MLLGLSISNIVLIERLDLSFGPGLTVLTGETGAGKSILLDALGLALGARAEQGLVRAGCDKANVAASFEVPQTHPVYALLQQHDIDCEPGEPLILRRSLDGDGRSRAFINDQPVSAATARAVGDILVEVHGQHAERGLLRDSGHRDLLDGFAGAEAEKAACRTAFTAWNTAMRTLDEARKSLSDAERDRAHLEGAVERLTALDPQPGEEPKLASERLLLQQGEKLGETLGKLNTYMTEGDSPASRISAALRLAEKAESQVPGRFTELVDALTRALSEAMEAEAQGAVALADLPHDQTALDKVEERLFALREEARRHAVPVEELPALAARLKRQLELIEGGASELSALEAKVDQTFAAYNKAAGVLSAKRRKAAKLLDIAVMKELPPVKLENAVFETAIEVRPATDGGPDGVDKVVFTIATNPGSKPGPLIKIASGGELSRILLALKVVLAKDVGVPTLIFDEVDKGIGGATADAVGERLQRLGADAQVLVVTHSPQVAARGAVHLNIKKAGKNGAMTTDVTPLARDERREELARMLSGAKVSDEARAAATRLLEATDG